MIKNFLFGTAGGARSFGLDLGILFLRVSIGLPMALAHGFPKLPVSEKFIQVVAELGFPAPAVFAWGAGLAEFIGGILLTIGLLTRPSALVIAATMAVAFFLQHAADPFKAKELAFVYLGASLALVFLGGGRFAIDRAFRRG